MLVGFEELVIQYNLPLSMETFTPTVGKEFSSHFFSAVVLAREVLERVWQLNDNHYKEAT
jgi:hypothetical protein